jgi:hypothetical protein
VYPSVITLHLPLEEKQEEGLTLGEGCQDLDQVPPQFLCEGLSGLPLRLSKAREDLLNSADRQSL